MALVEKAFGDIITFTRASGGGRINALGEYEWVAGNVPRLTHDPVTLQPLGLLVEEQRTNLLLRSTLEGGTAGTIGSGAVAPTGWSFPFTGGAVAFPVIALGTISIATTKTVNTDRPFIQQSISVLASTSYVLSTRVTSSSGTMKLGDLCTWAALPAGATQAYYRNGVLTTASAAEVLVYGDVISSVLTVSTTAGTAQARVGLGSAGDTSVTGSCSLTMPMVEQASSPSTYIPTTTAQVTRAADMCSVNTLSPWYNPLEGTIVCAFERLAAVANQTVWMVGRGSPNADSTWLFFEGNSPRLFYAGSRATTNIAALPLGRTKSAASFASGAQALALDGALAGSGALTTSPSQPPTTLSIGSAGGARPLNGIIASITYYPRVIDVQQASA